MEKIAGCFWKRFSPPTLEKQKPDPLLSSLSAVAVELKYVFQNWPRMSGISQRTHQMWDNFIGRA